jgi:hypothetical protein
LDVIAIVTFEVRETAEDQFSPVLDVLSDKQLSLPDDVLARSERMAKVAT